MKVLVCGGRIYVNVKRVNEVLDFIHNKYRIEEIINGGAMGADELARQWARRRRVASLTFPANWQRYGKSAGFHRNVKMLDEQKPDLIVAFPGGDGTAMTIALADERNIKVIKVAAEGEEWQSSI